MPTPQIAKPANPGRCDDLLVVAGVPPCLGGTMDIDELRQTYLMSLLLRNFFASAGSSPSPLSDVWSFD